MQIRIVRGADLAFAGKPRQALAGEASVGTVALMGEDCPGLRPVFMVAEGDSVKAGQHLFSDRRRPDIRYVAPVAGRVSALTRGPRRSLDALVIACEPEGEAESFEVPASLSRAGLVALLLESGAWPALRARPFGKVPDPDSAPDALFVTAIDTAPLAPDPGVAITEFAGWFRRGLEAVRLLCEGRVHVCHAPRAVIPPVPGTQPVAFAGPHPAGLPSTHIHHLHPVGTSGTVWHIGYQDVIAIGHLIETGRVWTQRVVSLAGPAVAAPALLLAPPGANLRELAEGRLKTGPARLLSGSPIEGRPEHYLARYHLQATALPHHAPRPEGTLLRRLRALTNAGVPALVPNAAHERVAPARILPVPFLRAIGIGDIETARRLGALELVEEDMALLSHVDGRGTDFGALLRRTLDELEAER